MKNVPATLLLLLTTGLGGAIALMALFLWFTRPMQAPFREAPAYLIASAIGLAVVELGWIARNIGRRNRITDLRDD